MNALEEWITDNCLDPTHAMNLLQNDGIISDLAITAADVAECDIPRAIQFLNNTTDKPLL